MRLSESPGATKDRFTLEALQKEEQENLKARMQIEMLKDQTRQQQAMLDTRQVKKNLILISKLQNSFKNYFKKFFIHSLQNYIAIFFFQTAFFDYRPQLV